MSEATPGTSVPILDERIGDAIGYGGIATCGQIGTSSASVTMSMGFLQPVGAIEVSPVLLLSSIGMIVVGIGASLRMPEFWRGGEYYERVLKIFLVFGETQGRAFTSAVPVASFGSAPFGANALALFGREITTGQLQSGLEIVATALLPATMVMIILLFGVTLFGRPRILIPPPLRGHRGIIGELIARAARWIHG